METMILQMITSTNTMEWNLLMVDLPMAAKVTYISRCCRIKLINGGFTYDGECNVYFKLLSNETY